MKRRSNTAQELFWQLRAHAGNRFRFTQITFAMMTCILALFAILESFSAVGRWPLFGLIFVTFIRIFFIRRRIDVWMSAALVVATSAAALYLAEISSLSVAGTLAMVTAVCSGVLIGLAFAQSDFFLLNAGMNHSLHLTLDLSSIVRISARLLPIIVIFAILLPDLLRYAHYDPRFESIFDVFHDDLDASGAAGSSLQTSGIGSNLDASRGSSLRLDWSPALVVQWTGAQPDSSLQDGIQYWRSHSLSQGFGLTWELAGEDLIADSENSADPASDNIAQVILAGQDELFLPHPSGTMTRILQGSLGSFVPLAGGGGMLKSMAAFPLARHVIYELHALERKPQLSPFPVHSRIPEEWQTKSEDLRLQVFAPAPSAETKSSEFKTDRIATQIKEFYRRLDLSYSLNPGPLLQKTAQSPLETFLFESKKGFCEHFAAATASLFRIGGVPARVVVGLASKVNKNETRTVMRHSDAHAWVEAWDEDLQRWKTIDPTTWIARYEDLPSQQQTSFAWEHLYEQATASFDSLGLKVALAMATSAKLSESGWLPSFIKSIVLQFEQLAGNLLFIKLGMICIAGAIGALIAKLAKKAWRSVPRSSLSYNLGRIPLMRRLAKLERRTNASPCDSEEANWSREKLLYVQHITAQRRNPSQSVAEYLVAICAGQPILESKVQRTIQAFNGLIYSQDPSAETAKQYREAIEEFFLHLKNNRK